MLTSTPNLLTLGRVAVIPALVACFYFPGELPRYLAAVAHRRERLDQQVARDRQLMDQVSGLQEAWLHAVAALPDGQPLPRHLRETRWMLEEYRVSLWAQQLGTREKVSDQRIRKVLGSVV